MEIYISLSADIRVEKQDAPEPEKVSDGQQAALDKLDQERIVSEYGIDATKEEIEEKEETRKKEEEEKKEEAKRTPPPDLGARKPLEDKDLTGSDIQDQHDLMIKL